MSLVITAGRWPRAVSTGTRASISAVFPEPTGPPIPTLNTFSAVEARKYVEQHGQHIVDTRRIGVQTFAQAVDANLGRTPNLVSLDVEGLELDILQSIDFSRHRPDVFCIETLSYAPGDGSGVKNSEIHALMLENGYMLYADTYINSIYVAAASWRALGNKR